MNLKKQADQLNNYLSKNPKLSKIIAILTNMLARIIGIILIPINWGKKILCSLRG